MRILSSLTAAIAIGASLMSVTPVVAGLGEATSKTQSSTYQAWCGKKGNECTVSFNDAKVTVNDIDSVDFGDISYITRNQETKLGFFKDPVIYTFGIEYQEEQMDKPEFAEILFEHKGTADRFWRDLKRACRQCKDRDATRIEVDITK